MNTESYDDFENDDDERAPEIHAEPDAPAAKPNVPRLTLHVDLPDLDPETIRKAVIDTAISQWVLDRTYTTVKRRKWVQDRDGNGKPVGRAVQAEVVEQVEGPVAFRELIQKEVSAQITTMIQPHLREILVDQVKEILDGEVQTMDQWGSPKGPKMQVRELIRTTLDAFMREKVDSAGRSESHGGKTRLEWAVLTSANEVFKGTFQPMVTTAVESIKAEVSAKTADALRVAVLQALGIKTP